MTTIHPRKHDPIGPGPGDGTLDPWPTRAKQGRSPLPRVVALGVCTHIRPDGQPCGWVHTRCSGHSSAGNYPERQGDPCGQTARAGVTVCPSHGGDAPQVKAYSEQVRHAEAAEKAVRRRLGKQANAAPIHDPASELARLAGEIRARVDALADMVDALEEDNGPPDSLDEALSTGVTQFTPVGRKMAPEVDLLFAAQKDLGKLLVDMGKLGIAERHAEVEEATAMMLLAAVRGALAAAAQRGLVLDATAVEALIGEQVLALEAGTP